MSGRPAPPGRKGSVRINAFKADDETATPVSVATMTAAERQKHERDEEMKKLMALRKQAQAEESGAPEVKKVETPSKQADVRDASSEEQKKKERAEADKKRLEEVRARNAKLEEDERAADAARLAALDAEKAAAAKKAADEAEKVKAAAAAKKAAEDAERAAAAKKAADEAEKAAAIKKAADEAERARESAKQAALDAERAAAAKRAAEEAENAAAAKKAADEAEKARADAKKAAEEAERAAAAKRAADEAEKAAAAKKAADEAEKVRADAKKAAEEAERAAAAERAAEEEKAREAREAAVAEEERKVAEAAHVAALAAKEERRLQKEAEKAAKAEQARALLEEQQKREQEEADAEEAAYQAEQERQKIQLEAQRKKREEDEAKRQLEQQEFLRQQELLEEQQRRMDEKAALQRAALAEAAANEKREQEALQQKQQAEAEERKRAKQEELAARQAAEQAEIARLREEEAVRQQALIDAQRREEEEHAAEAARLEQDRIAAAEEARKAEEAISQYENAALEEKKRRAEAQRKKREAFLNDMDTFSTNFEAKTQVEDESIKAEQDKHYELLAQQMKQVEEAKAATSAKEAKEKEQRAAQLAAAAEIAAAELAAANVPPPAPVAVRSTAPKEDTYSINLNGSEEPKRDLLGDLTSSLFTSAPAPAPASAPVAVAAPAVVVQEVKVVEEVTPAAEERTSPAAMDSIEEEEDGEEEAEPAANGGTEELRVPTRIGSGKAVKGSKVQHKPVSVSVINARTAAATVKYSEDEEEEGTGEAGSISNVLTLEERRKLTLAQKETWRAKQADLTEKRKDFHGVVTYTFDGVFSWQMYGSAEAVDESGSNYTEYLMRCQWGTTFENMQPWIVAHRYKEFDLLDQQLKKKFPRLEANMPKLPKKELFRSLQADVVAQRRAVLEEYMSKIVNSMPSLVRSELMNDFLDITNRISGIRLMLLKMSNAKVEALHTPPPTPTPSRPVSTTPISKGPVTGVSSNSKYGIEDPLAFRSVANEPEPFANEVEEEPLYWTQDDAEEARAAKNSRSLDEDQLGRLEIDVRALGVLIRKENGKALVARDSKFRTTFKTVSARWPSLRATAVVGMGVDFTLIPRAMQTEEDLIRYINEFRNIETLSGMSRAGVSV